MVNNLKKSPVPFFLIEIFVGFSLAIISILIFAEIAENVFGHETQALDVTISRSFYALRTPWLTNLMLFFSFLGAEFTLLLASLGAIFLALKKRKRESILFSCIFIMGVVINFLLKMMYQRPRPELSPLVHMSSFSFPSGHAMNAFIFYSILSFFVWHLTHKKRLTILVSCISACLIILIGLSRVYLGVHYPSDVLAGYVTGAFVFTTAIVVQRTMAYFYYKKRRSELKEIV